jgi:hypothetical protein
VSVFFTADTHFGDHRTINIARRPFADTAAMDAALIDRWNASGRRTWYGTLATSRVAPRTWPGCSRG